MHYQLIILRLKLYLAFTRKVEEKNRLTNLNYNFFEKFTICDNGYNNHINVINIQEMKA